MRTIILLTLALTSPPALADEVRLEPVRDTTLYETADGSLANGAGEHMFTGMTGMGERRRLLLAFDVAAHVPKGSTVHTISLELFMSKTISTSHDFAFHRVTNRWGEGISDAPLEEGGGAPSERDDATWLHTFYPGQFWLTLGGDYDPTASGIFPIDGVGKYFLDSPGMVADVQAWADGAQDDFGWILKQDVEAGPVTAKRFSTRESSVDFLRPILVIQFTPTEIGTPYCGPAVNNSTGVPGAIRALGSDFVADESVFLRASSLPTSQFGYFLNSQQQGFITNPGGSQGNLCLSGQIGRYVTLVSGTGATDTLQIKLDLSNTPTPTGPVTVQPGETWNFTCWHRDLNPGPTSNFTDGVSVTFQ